MHRKYFKTSPHEHIPFGSDFPAPDVICRSIEKRQRVEWQADQFAAYLLMPQRMLLEAWRELRGDDVPSIEQAEIHELTANDVITYRGREPQNQTERDKGASELFCRPLADEFQVSREALRIRLESLNWIVTSRVSTLL
ncbi:MAG TPA: ImmA/IrrE family metallo-endopeptidase [Pirellula sp.]|nr:ImmA/IrrE family metallo-endopeptidase [Pirellula sp.]